MTLAAGNRMQLWRKTVPAGAYCILYRYGAMSCRSVTTGASFPSSVRAQMSRYHCGLPGDRCFLGRGSPFCDKSEEFMLESVLTCLNAPWHTCHRPCTWAWCTAAEWLSSRDASAKGPLSTNRRQPTTIVHATKVNCLFFMSSPWATHVPPCRQACAALQTDAPEMSPDCCTDKLATTTQQ